MRVLLVVAGLISMVSLMGATAKPELKRSARPVGALRAETISEIKNLPGPELLFDLPDTSDADVRQSKPVVRQVSMEVTAYCACTKCCGPNASGITASGHNTGYNNSSFVAADPSLPFGTKVVIPGYSSQPVEVIDRGSAIRGNKIDVFFPSHDQAVKWGRRQIQVTILNQ